MISFHFFLVICLFIFFPVVLGLHCCTQAFSACGKPKLLSSCDTRASHRGGFSCCRAQAPGTQASVAVAHGLRCSPTGGLFLDQGSNPRSLHWHQILVHCTTRETLISFIFNDLMCVCVYVINYSRKKRRGWECVH